MGSLKLDHIGYLRYPANKGVSRSTHTLGNFGKLIFVYLADLTIGDISDAVLRFASGSDRQLSSFYKRNKYD